MGNPQRALDAMLDGERQISGHTVYPLSIARYALLEKTGSPLLTGEEDIQKTLQTLYIMTQPVEQLAAAMKAGTLEQDAFIWGDKLDIPSLKHIVADIRGRLADVMYLAPDTDDDGKKKQQTAG